MHPLILGFVASAAAWWWYSNRAPETFPEGSTVFRMFKANWCGHCKAALPEFKKLGSYQSVNGRKVYIEIIDVDQQRAMADKFGVKSYPTFILTSDTIGNKEYSGPRKYADFMAFLRANV